MKAEPSEAEALIAEFKKEILNESYAPDWCSVSWYWIIEQAARNLLEKAVMRRLIM